MNFYLTVLIRVAFTCVAFFVIQNIIPYYYLVAGGLLAGVFMLKTGDDKALSYGLLIGSVLFGLFAWKYGNV